MVLVAGGSSQEINAALLLSSSSLSLRAVHRACAPKRRESPPKPSCRFQPKGARGQCQPRIHDRPFSCRKVPARAHRQDMGFSHIRATVRQMVFPKPFRQKNVMVEMKQFIPGITKQFLSLLVCPLNLSIVANHQDGIRGEFEETYEHCPYPDKFFVVLPPVLFGLLQLSDPQA